MKFGHTLMSHQVPEWQQHYIDYKILKKIIKCIHTREAELRADAESHAQQSEVDVFTDSQVKMDLARFFFHLDSNVEKVDEFYTKKYLDYEKRLKKIVAVFPRHTEDINSYEEYDDLVDILLELRNCFRNLKWYAELNRRGFVKILKKLDKKTGTKKQDAYISAKVHPASFCNEADTVKCLTTINDYLSRLLNDPDADDNDANLAQNYKHQFTNGSSASTISNLDINPAARTGSGDVSNAQFGSSDALASSLSDLNKLPPPSSVNLNSRLPVSKTSSLEIYSSAIKADDVEQMDSILTREYMSPVLAPLKLLLSLLNKATLELSYKCIDSLLKIIPVLLDSGDVSGRNFLHHHVIALGKKSPSQNGISNSDYNIGELRRTEFNPSLFNTAGPDGINSNDSSKGLWYIFQNLPAHLKFAILQKDNYKRTPLHYASQYGLKEVTFIILQYLKEWNMYNESISLDDVNTWGDSENLTPIHLAILGKHPKTTEVLINSMNEDVSLTCPYLLQVATRMNTPGLLTCLLKCKGIDINSYENEESKETALYIAAKYDLKESVQALIENHADTEIGESTFGWTPIFVAASNGFTEIIDLLISNGAKFDIQDESGWTPREHAALRGHIDIIDKLTPANYNPYDSLENPKLSPKLVPKMNRNPSTSSIHRIPERAKTPEINKMDKIDLDVLKNVNNSVGNLPLPLSSTSSVSATTGTNSNGDVSTSTTSTNRTIVGNRYLKKGESMIMLTIGTTDLRDETPAIDLKKIPSSKIHSTELDSALSIVISTPSIKGQSEVSLALPLDDNHGGSSDPITFKCNNQDPFDTTIYFDIIPTFDVDISKNDKNRKILGRGVAILKNLYTPVGNNMRSLFNCVKIPILEMSTMEVLGTIKFEVLIIKSFEETGKIPQDADMYWRSLIHPRLIGHRGNGMNSRDKKSLQLGENTVESFIAAASLGAQYVEFDVQLTKDNVPVIYHDFIIAESGIDIPMQSLTLEQFMNLNLSKEKMRKDKEKKIIRDDSFINTKPRSKSISYRKPNGKLNRPALFQGGSDSGTDEYDQDARICQKEQEEEDDDEEDPTHQRMRLTKTWKDKEFKANIRGSTIASSFTTLEEIFAKVPKSAGFNIELKYPMLDESEIDSIGQTAPEMNHFCDTILSMVYDKYNGRNVIFSSFHPDICILMTYKQPSFPVLFLTESGVDKMADVRASSLQNAIRFAKNWKLFGIVSNAIPFIKCPRLASVVKNSGLACFTYGSANNDPENAKLEIAAGVDAVIVDSVLAVRKELTKYDESKSGKIPE